MSVSLSTKYYLQALEAYPYDLTETIESLSYALSYDKEHAGAHCLYGQLYMEKLRQFGKAEYHFEQALLSDFSYVVTYEYYSLLLIHIQDYKKAMKLIQYAYSLKGVNHSVMMHREALISERQKLYNRARKLMQNAYKESCDEESRRFLKDELERVKSKFKEKKKKKSEK